MKDEWKPYFRAGVSLFALFLAIRYWEAFAGLLGAVGTAVRPLVIGCLMAYILNIPMSFFERLYFPKDDRAVIKATRRPACLVLALLCVLLAVTMLIVIVAPELGRCVSLLLSRVPAALDGVGDYIAGLPWTTEGVRQALEKIDWQTAVPKLVNTVLGGLGSAGDYAVTIASSVVSVTANSFIGLIFAIYVLMGKEKLGRQLRAVCRRYLPKGLIKKGEKLMRVSDECFHKFFVGQCTEAVILGALCAAGMVILGFPYAAVGGVTVGFTALVPVAGAYIGGGVGFLLILTESPVKALLFIVYLVLLQQFEGDVIYPKVVGGSIGLPGIWVLSAVIVGGSLAGIWGMLAGVPIFAIAYRLIRDDVKRPAKN